MELRRSVIHLGSLLDTLSISSSSKLIRSNYPRSNLTATSSTSILSRQSNACSSTNHNQLVQQRWFHSTNSVNHLMKLTRCRVVDNSPIGKQAMAEGKPPKIIHVYRKTGIGTIGDKVLVAIRGEMKKAIIVGVRKNQRPFLPRTDSNNIVLIEDNGTPLGTRIHVPIPIILRKILKENSMAKGPDYSPKSGP